MLTFATLVGLVGLAAALFCTAMFTGLQFRKADRDGLDLVAWVMCLLTIGFIVAGVIACGGALATLAKAVQS